MSLALLTAAGPTGATAAAEPWWEPLGLRGGPVTAVAVDDDGRVTVGTPNGTRRSGDGGHTFQPVAGMPRTVRSAGCVRGSTCAARRPEGGAWRIIAGRVVAVATDGVAALDGESPDLGSQAELVAAVPGSEAGLVAVAADGTVWRRRANLGWSRSLVLLPTTLGGGVPAVTAITTFITPVTSAVYLGVDGYSVLISNDGGDDWVRAGPGLPDRVLSLATDATSRSVYAGTADGLWVHHVQRLPAPPEYADQDLRLRWVGVVLVALTASAGALSALRWASRRPERQVTA